MSIGAQQFINLLGDNKKLADERDQLQARVAELEHKIINGAMVLVDALDRVEELTALLRSVPALVDPDDYREREWAERKEAALASAGADKPSSACVECGRRVGPTGPRESGCGNCRDYGATPSDGTDAKAGDNG